MRRGGDIGIVVSHQAYLLEVCPVGGEPFQPGTVDPGFRDGVLYQWAPRNGKTIDQFTWTPSTTGEPSMAFGDAWDSDEWPLIKKAGVTLFEFKNVRALELYRVSMERAEMLGSHVRTPNGDRWCVPLIAFKVIDARDGSIKREPSML